MAYRYSTGNPTLDMLRNGVRQTESSGNYRALGPFTKNGDRAYGAFQVMGSNIPNWTLKALGYPMTKEQFLADDKAQEAVFNHQFGGYLQKYGNPQDAVSAWFTGRPVAQAGNASDGYNNNGQYINKVFKNAGMPAVGQDPRSFQATGSDDMAGPAPAQPDAASTMDLPNNEQTNWSGIGSSLTNLGSIVAGLDKSIGGQLMARNLSNVASNQLREQALNQKDNKWSFAGFTPNKTGALFSNGTQTVVRPLGEYGGDEKTQMEKDYDATQRNPELKTAFDGKYNTDKPDTPALTEADYDRFLQTEMAGGKLGTVDFGTGKDSNSNRINYQRYKTENLARFGLKPDDLVRAQTDNQFRGRVARDLGGTELKFTSAYNNFMGGSKVLEEYAQKYPREWPKIIEAAKQGTILGLNIPGIGAKDLAALDTAMDTTAVEYAKAKNPSNSQLTISEQKEAATKFRSTMGEEELSGRLSAMRRELDSNRDRMLTLHRSIIGDHVISPLSSSTSAEPPQNASPQPAPASDDLKDAFPMPSSITTPDQFREYVKKNQIKSGTKFNMGGRTIYAP